MVGKWFPAEGVRRFTLAVSIELMGKHTLQYLDVLDIDFLEINVSQSGCLIAEMQLKLTVTIVASLDDMPFGITLITGATA